MNDGAFLAHGWLTAAVLAVRADSDKEKRMSFIRR